jgi:excisionase family DNA binding protein
VSKQSAPGATDRQAESLLLSVTQTARMVNLSGMTVRRRIHSGAWPGGRSGRKLLVPRAFVDDLIAAIESGSELVNAESYAAQRAAERQAAAAS